jgi:hypothetical protein
MSTMNPEVVKRFGLGDDVVLAERYLSRFEVTRIDDVVIQHAFTVVLMMVERSGLTPEQISFLLVYLVKTPGVHLGALAMFDRRFATLAPPTGAAVHLDIIDLKEVGDPVRAGKHPLISTIVHLHEYFRLCKEAFHGNGNVP